MRLYRKWTLISFSYSEVQLLSITIASCYRYTESCRLSVFNVDGVDNARSVIRRTCFDFRDVVAPRFVVDKMSINEVTELSMSPCRADVVLMNIGRRHLITYAADSDTSVVADMAALRRW